MAEYTINLPATDEDVEKLNMGDTVYINGTVCTARTWLTSNERTC